MEQKIERDEFLQVVAMSAAERSEYDGATIKNIRRGKLDRTKIVYAEIWSADGKLLVSATLAYCAEVLAERIS